MQAFKESWRFWLIGGVFMALMPIGEKPHLVQKLHLLINGWLKDPMDWFDLALHGLPLLTGLLLTTLVIIDKLKKKA